jgi:hypothetical protein
MALVATIEPEVDNVRLDYTVPAGGTTVTFTRVGPSGISAGVRGWVGAAASPGAVIARDFEVPIGVLVTYTAQTFNSSGGVVDTQTVQVTIPSTGCTGTWLNDLARVTNTLQVEIESLPELDYQMVTSTHEVIDRRDPIVTSDVAHTPEFELSFLTDTLDQRDQARDALGNGVPVLLRTPPDLGIGNLYFAVTDYKEQRIVTSGTMPARVHVVTGRQVQRPDPTLYVPLGVATYAHVKATFATYAALKAGRVNYDAVLYDWAGSEPSDIVPWPPTDV